MIKDQVECTWYSIFRVIFKKVLFKEINVKLNKCNNLTKIYIYLIKLLFDCFNCKNKRYNYDIYNMQKGKMETIINKKNSDRY